MTMVSGSRQELRSVRYITKAANQRLYMQFASNWCEMYVLDLTVIIRAFIANPSQFNDREYHAGIRQ